MINELSDYVFPQEERMIFPAALAILFFVFVAITAITILFSLLSFKIFLILMGALLVCLLCLLIDHIRYQDIRKAKFFLSCTKASLQYGKTKITFSANDKYTVSILRLYHTLGRGYTFKQYLVLWDGSALTEEVHPSVLIKQGCIVIPLMDTTLDIVKQFAYSAEIPMYPKVLHHPGSISNIHTATK